MMKDQDKSVSKEIQLVIFRLHNEEFGLEINQVREIVRMTEITQLPLAPGFIVGVINLRSEVIPVVDLAKQFDLPPLEGQLKAVRIIVVEVGGNDVGLIVDEAPEVIKIAEENIEPVPEIIQMKIKANYFTGVAKSGERLIIILNLDRLLAETALPEQTGEEDGQHTHC